MLLLECSNKMLDSVWTVDVYLMITSDSFYSDVHINITSLPNIQIRYQHKSPLFQIVTF